MAPLQESSYSSSSTTSTLRKVLLLYYLALIFLTSSVLISASQELELQKKNEVFGRKLHELDDELDKPIKKKTSTISTSSSLLSTKNQTKLAKTNTNGSAKNQTKLIKTSTNSSSSKNQTKNINKLPSDQSLKNKTKLIKPTSDSNTNEKPTFKSQLKKLNSTTKSSNSAKNSTLLTKKSSDLLSKASSSAKNKTSKTTTIKDTKIKLDKDLSGESKSDTNSKSTSKDQSSNKKPKSEKANQQKLPSWIDQEDEEDDLVSEFRDLTSKFQETLLPDLERISKTSQVYLNRANKQITRGFKPIVGNKYAPTIASIVSFAFLLIPLILVSLIFNRIKAYFSLQKILIFIQIYLSIYFSILCLSSLASGLEPLRFLYATSQSTYVCLQVMQTLAYVLYLLLLLMYLILVFSTETGLVTKLLGLGQTFVGFAVGLHYYMTVFHRAVLHQPPKTSWKLHAIYATCFLVICLLTRADRRKKAYLGGAEEGKMS